MWIAGLGVAVSFLATALFILILSRLAPRFGLMDCPGGRKDHGEPTPTVGGLAMFAGAAIGLVGTTVAAGQVPMQVVGFALAATILVLDGLLDDVFDLRWYVRVLNQVLAALAIVFVGDVTVENVGPMFGIEVHPLGALSVPFTVFATVGLINAVNMADGVDGLAGSLVLASLAMLASAAAYAGNIYLLGGLAVMMAAVFAFLLFNMRLPWQRRARVFMGDAGSSLLGLVIAWSAFRLTQNPEYPVSPILGPFFLALPVIDCLNLILRRVASGRSPFAADRGHLHHLLLDAGYSPSAVVMLMTAASVGIGATAALAYRAGVPEVLLVAAFVSLALTLLWLTSRRERAVAGLRGLRGALKRPVHPPVLPIAGE